MYDSFDTVKLFVMKLAMHEINYQRKYLNDFALQNFVQRKNKSLQLSLINKEFICKIECCLVGLYRTKI